jgi:hypothetical protein
MSDEWSTERTVEEKNIVFVEDDEIEVAGEITADKVKEIANDHGIKNFHVRNTDGKKITAGIFPVSENLVISAINKAG